MSFTDRSRAIAAEFLQTVIVVDDLARLRDNDAESATTSADAARSPEGGIVKTGAVGAPVPVAVPPDGELALAEPSKDQLKAASDDNQDSDDLDAKELVDGFASRGLVCAVIKPDAAEVQQIAETAALKKADIVVLDWVIHKDHGDAALRVIETLLTSDPDRLRLVAIYTGQHDLLQIVERIAQAVGTYLPERPVARPDGFSVEKGPARIVVYAKPKARIPVENAEARAQLTEWVALPERLVADFASMTSGLVQQVAVASLSALRKNTHRILRRVSQPLDAAYLWHRAMQAAPEDAEEDLKTIVVDEVASVLDDENVEQVAGIEAIEDWLTFRVPNDDYQDRFGLGQARTRADAVNLLSHGLSADSPESKAAKTAFHSLAKNPHSKTADRRCFASTVVESTAAQENFAALLSIRTRYSAPTPRLVLGTVLRTGQPEATNYWVCVQPICDCVRLTKETAFPLLPLTVGGERFDLVLSVAGQPSLRLKLEAKPLHIKMATFTPNTGAVGAVEALKEGANWYLSETNGTRYEWLAELKPHHALRVADMLSGELRRVGLTESEWLRRWSKG